MSCEMKKYFTFTSYGSCYYRAHLFLKAQCRPSPAVAEAGDICMTRAGDSHTYDRVSQATPISIATSCTHLLSYLTGLLYVSYCMHIQLNLGAMLLASQHEFQAGR